jgi:hypothetical protein
MVQRKLRKPTRFTASKPPFYRKKSKAISWFKDSAQNHLAHIRGLVAILQHHGVSVRMLKTERVGYVVYEDEYQIVAEPHGRNVLSRFQALFPPTSHCGQARSDKSITPCNSSREAPPADCTDIPCITAITYRAKSPASAAAGKFPSSFARSNRSRSAASPVARRAINSFRIGSASSPQASAPCTIKHPFGFPGHESKSAVPTINRSATARAVGSFSASAVYPVIRSEYRSSAFRNNASLFPNVA